MRRTLIGMIFLLGALLGALVMNERTADALMVSVLLNAALTVRVLVGGVLWK